MGILANSASVTMTSSSADDTNGGYVVGEQVVLTTNPTGTTYAWAVSKPAGSSSRGDLTGDDTASVSFTPDSAGTWTLTCTVDSSTVYVLRITATAVAVTSIANAHKFAPVTNNSVPAPAVGFAFYCSSTAGNKMRQKNSAGVVLAPDATFARTGTFLLVAGSATIVDTSVTASTTIIPCCTTATNRGDLTFTFNAGVGITVTSDDNTDGSAYRYALFG